MFLKVFRHYFRKRLRKFAVLLRLSSNLQGIRLFYCIRCANNKIDHFRSIRNKFWAKQRRKKTCFLGFLRHYLRKTLCKLAVLHRLNPNLQGSRLFFCIRCANNKTDHFRWKKNRFWAKKRRKKNRFFWGFPTLLQQNASQICCIAPIELKLTGYPPILLYQVCKQ